MRPIAWLRREPGFALLLVGLVLGLAMYLPTVERGVVNYDDPLLVENNHVLQQPSLASLRTIFFDLDPTSPARYSLTPEYLPVRDLSVMLDFAVWGKAYGGFHLTNLVLYLIGIALVFAWLDAFGVERTVAGCAALFWAVHASHAESVAWLSERKGLLGLAFAALAGLGYAQYRRGRSRAWLGVAVVAAVCAVWSKAPAAFTVASFAGLELVLPARRVSWRRSLAGLAAICLCGVLAFVPVVQMAMAVGIVGESSAIPGHRAVVVLGSLGFYTQLAAMAIPNAVSYPISVVGPSAIQIIVAALVAIGLAVALARRAPAPLRASAVLFLATWLPVSHLVLPLQMVAVADRYALHLTIATSLALAFAVSRVRSLPIRRALTIAIVLAGITRSLDARDNWEHDTALWRRATESNPHDGGAWGQYVQALMNDGDGGAALVALRRGLAHVRAPELLLRQAMILEPTDPAAAIALLEEAAVTDGQATATLAVLLLDRGRTLEALATARRAAQQIGKRAFVHRVHGKIALAAGAHDEAIAAYERAHELDERNPGGRCELAHAYVAGGRVAEARRLLVMCATHPVLGAAAGGAEQCDSRIVGKILVVDDEQSMREFLTIYLKRGGHEVTVASSGAQAIERLRDVPIDVVVTDLKMPGEVDGLALLKAIKTGTVMRAAHPKETMTPVDPEVILVTAFATADTAIAAMKQGAYDYLTKPFQIDEISAVIGRALEKRALLEDNQVLRDQLAGRARLAQLLGKSRAMQKVFELIGKIHSTKTNVLVTGESGTGKELVARALHSEGSRANNKFVAVNCGAIPEELMESELFGHKKGAFTGAVADKPGLFQEADGGTLFLDEIGELSLGLQVKLLRVLQERKVKTVGGTEEIEIDVRVIAATNRDLEAEVARGAFRADLYYRLNVIELRLPPLRHRREDIPLLAEHFLRRFGTEHNRQSRMSPAAMRRIESHDFPGNVRELENMIERAVALSSSPLIDVDDMPDMKASKALTAEVTPAAFPAEGVDLERLVSDFERSWVTRALDHTGGVRKRAATLLGISFRSLRYRLEKLGIEKSDPSGTDGES